MASGVINTHLDRYNPYRTSHSTPYMTIGATFYSPLIDLPQELKSSVASCLEGDGKSLKRLSLVHSSFVAPAREYMFMALVVRPGASAERLSKSLKGELSLKVPSRLSSLRIVIEPSLLNCKLGLWKPANVFGSAQLAEKLQSSENLRNLQDALQLLFRHLTSAPRKFEINGLSLQHCYSQEQSHLTMDIIRLPHVSQFSRQCGELVLKRCHLLVGEISDALLSTLTCRRLVLSGCKLADTQHIVLTMKKLRSLEISDPRFCSFERSNMPGLVLMAPFFMPFHMQGLQPPLPPPLPPPAQPRAQIAKLSIDVSCETSGVQYLIQAIEVSRLTSLNIATDILHAFRVQQILDQCGETLQDLEYRVIVDTSTGKLSSRGKCAALTRQIDRASNQSPRMCILKAFTSSRRLFAHSTQRKRYPHSRSW